MLILQNARLIPELSEGWTDGHADIRICGDHIETIAPAGTLSGDCPTLDLKGKTLLPGLFDLHMHMYFAHDDFAALALQDHNNTLIDSIEYLKLFLENGYTTVRDCGNPDYIGVAIRDGIARGVIEGPRVFTAGLCITPTARGNDTFPRLYDEVDRIDDILGVCRREFSHGIDFLKYMATGSVANVTGEPGAQVASREEIFAVQQAAEALGTYTGMHCHGTSGIMCCIDAGVATIEHASFMTGACIDRILQLGSRSALVPTLTPVCEIWEDVDGNTPAYLKRKIPAIWNAAGMLVTAQRAGVQIGWGSDCAMSVMRAHPGYEFYARSRVGFSNIEMLQQATINSARILHLQERLGSIKAAKLADLIVVDGKPDQDISVMQQRPVLVMKEGVIHRCSL